jgi:hypothetical protein
VIQIVQVKHPIGTRRFAEPLALGNELLAAVVLIPTMRKPFDVFAEGLSLKKVGATRHR